MKVILFSVIFLILGCQLLHACDFDTDCQNYQYCSDSICKTRQPFCENNSDCGKNFLECDTRLHTCFHPFNGCISDNDCQSYAPYNSLTGTVNPYFCNLDIGRCAIGYKSCNSDSECTTSWQYCDPNYKTCMQKQNYCSEIAACYNTVTTICNIQNNKCVEPNTSVSHSCQTDSDCGESWLKCVGFNCKVVEGSGYCVYPYECGDPIYWCEAQTHKCIMKKGKCLSDSDCSAPYQSCQDYNCKAKPGYCDKLTDCGNIMDYNLWQSCSNISHKCSLLNGYCNSINDCQQPFEVCGPSKICIAASGYCKTDFDCPIYMSCSDNSRKCALKPGKCGSDVDCQLESYCSVINSTCVLREKVCNLDSECQNGNSCVSHSCVAVNSTQSNISNNYSCNEMTNCLNGYCRDNKCNPMPPKKINIDLSTRNIVIPLRLPGMNSTKDSHYFYSLNDEIASFYSANSYGHKAFPLFFLFNNESNDIWFDIDSSKYSYLNFNFSVFQSTTYDFYLDAISSQVFDYVDYDQSGCYSFENIILVFPGSSQQLDPQSPIIAQSKYTNETLYDIRTRNGKRLCFRASHLITLSENDNMGVWAHELAHSLPSKNSELGLSDRYNYTDFPSSLFRQYGFSGYFDLMDKGAYDYNIGIGTNIVKVKGPFHMSSYSKEAVGWLNYLDLPVNTTRHYDSPELAVRSSNVDSGVIIHVNDTALESKYYGALAVRIPSRKSNEYYVVEARDDSRHMAFSNYYSGLLVYRVSKSPFGYDIVNKLDTQLPSETSESTFRSSHYSWPTVFIGSPTNSNWDNIPDGWRIRSNTSSYDGSAYRANYSIEPLTTRYMTGGILDIIGGNFVPLGPIQYLPLAKVTFPDVDLHAVDSNGRHVGMNYETGVYENNIPGAVASGNLFNDEEWIFAPSIAFVDYYVVRTSGSTESTNYSKANFSLNFTLAYYDVNGTRNNVKSEVYNITSSKGNHSFNTTSDTMVLSLSAFEFPNVRKLNDNPQQVCCLPIYLFIPLISAAFIIRRKIVL